MTAPLRLYTFSPGFGLPTSGPFGLKLELALRATGVPYERHVWDNLLTAPKRKIPFVERGGERVGDSELILRWLGVDPDAGLSAAERAVGLGFRRLLEEHWHQVFEYELFVHPEGFATSARTMAPELPAIVRWIAARYLRRHFRRHLFERGIGRHTPDEIADFGRRDLDAIAAWLDGKTWFFGDRPTLTDCSAFGLLAPALGAPHQRPAMAHARSLPPIVAFVERCRTTWFPEVRGA
ncbi:MAG: glutathione S-transferase family protein [Myxococcota bacterium]